LPRSSLLRGFCFAVALASAGRNNSTVNLHDAPAGMYRTGAHQRAAYAILYDAGGNTYGAGRDVHSAGGDMYDAGAGPTAAPVNMYGAGMKMHGAGRVGDVTCTIPIQEDTKWSFGSKAGSSSRQECFTSCWLV
jgi:hypothetical protein